MMIDRVGTAATGIAGEGNARQVNNKGDSSRPGNEAVRATLSSDTVSLSSLVERAMQSTATRQEKVEAVRASLQDGSYQIDTNAIATAMLGNQAGWARAGRNES